MQQFNNLTIRNLGVAFFGNPEESVIVLEKLVNANCPVVCVVTKPPQPVGRKQTLTPSPVSTWATTHNLPVLTFAADTQKPWQFADEQKVTQEILKSKPDILVSADYTQKIPISLISQIKYGGLNIHPSLLPAYRGPAPVPWQILNGETETGVSIVTLAEEFDAGDVIAQEKEPLLPTYTTPILLTRLFTKGADLLVKTLPEYFAQQTKKPINLDQIKQSSYYPRLTRADGFIPWELVKTAIEGKTLTQSTIKQFNNLTIVKAWNNNKKNGLAQASLAVLIDRSFRAFHPWPGIWTKVKINNAEKRLKILKLHLTSNFELRTSNLRIDQIQLEGKQPLDTINTSMFLKYKLGI